MDNQPATTNGLQQPKKRDLSGTMPGYRIYEYQLVLSPPEVLRDKIMRVKQHFADQYKNTSALYQRPQITLASFVQYGMMEEKLLNRLEVVAMGAAPFKVELKDYGSFPSHSIHINVTSKLQVQNLVKLIRTEAQRLMKLNNENKPYFVMDPYIAIARKLQPWQYEQGWAAYKHHEFTGRFIADAMLLLRRPINEPKYQIVRRFELMNLPVTTVQGALFS